MLTFIESEYPLYFQEEIVDIAGIFLEDDTVQLADVFNPMFGLSQLVRLPNLYPTLPLIPLMIAPRDWVPSSKETTPLAYR